MSSPDENLHDNVLSKDSNSTVQRGRKSSVHDIDQVNEESRHKILKEISNKICELQFLMEKFDSIESIRNTFIDFKKEIFQKINLFLSKVENQTKSNHEKLNSNEKKTNAISNDCQHLVFLIELFHNNLFKYQYFILSFIEKQNPIYFQDLEQIKKDLVQLENDAFKLNQRYSSEIFHVYCQDEKWSNPNEDKMFQSKQIVTSRPNSTIRNEYFYSSPRIYKICQIICSICQPKYL